MELELKTFSLGEVKSVDSEGMNFSGQASVFNNIDSYGDIMVRGSFVDSLKSGRKVKVLWQHKWSEPIGVIKSINEGSAGLEFSAELVDTTRGVDAFKLIKARAVDQMSFGFSTQKATWVSSAEELEAALKGSDVNELDANEIRSNTKDALARGEWVRLVFKVTLFEVSPVTLPANEKAFIDAVKGASNLKLDTRAKRPNTQVIDQLKGILGSFDTKAVDNKTPAAMINSLLSQLG